MNCQNTCKSSALTKIHVLIVAKHMHAGYFFPAISAVLSGLEEYEVIENFGINKESGLK